MDVDLGCLEREVEEGIANHRCDVSTLGRLCGEYFHIGRANKAVSISKHAFAGEPCSDVLRDVYLGCGGFYVSEVQHPILGDSFCFHNLEVDGCLYDVIEGKGFLDSHAEKTQEQWFARARELDKKLRDEHLHGKFLIPNTKVIGAINLACFDYRNYTPLQEKISGVVAHYRSQEIIAQPQIVKNRPVTGTRIDYDYLNLTSPVL